MNLDEYLEALKTESTDEHLIGELGAYDNWHILLAAKFDKFVQSLKNVDKFGYKRKSSDGRNEFFRFVPNGTRVDVQDYLFHTYPLPGEEESQARQIRDYQITTMMHPTKRDLPKTKSMAEAIVNLLEYVRSESIPFCIPSARGINHPFDFSRIVYFQS